MFEFLVYVAAAVALGVVVGGLILWTLHAVVARHLDLSGPRRRSFSPADWTRHD